MKLLELLVQEKVQWPPKAHAKAMLGIDPYADEDADDEHP